jgi:hypothetical protein
MAGPVARGVPLRPARSLTMRIRLAGLAIAGLLAGGAGAESPSQQSAATNPVGVWRGASVCLVRPSSCNDEIVVYRIARARSADSLTVDARKIVRGEEQKMGVLTCRPHAAERTPDVHNTTRHLAVSRTHRQSRW